MDEYLKNRISNYTITIEKITDRIIESKNNTQAIINKYGINSETYSIAVDFHKMKVDELELLGIILNAIFNDVKKTTADESVIELLNNLRRKSDTSILEAKQELDDILKSQ